jgi:hypothetical protein
MLPSSIISTVRRYSAGLCSFLELPQTNVISAMFRTAPPSLFALIIGIDKYLDSNFNDLSGAVFDAIAVENFLVENLSVPRANIERLHNDNASRTNIIKEIQRLATHPRIQKNNPILIYFAGHGSQTRPPEWFTAESTDAQIQMLIPHDFDGSNKYPATAERQGILDINIACLLKEIANKKGDNIVRDLAS